MNNAEITKIENNIFSISKDDHAFFLVINTVIPIMDEGKVEAQVRLFRSSDAQWSFVFSAPFGFVLKQFKEQGVSPTQYMLEQLKIELLRELNLDFTEPFNSIVNWKEHS